LLAQGAARLPLFGTQAPEMRRVRDPATFFGFLKACGFAYPAVRHDRGGEARGWLLKDAGGCGGSHIVRAADRAATGPTLSASTYLQREAPGAPMSATFIANGRDAAVLGFNEQILRSHGGRPFVFGGVLGPVPVPEVVRREVAAIARAVAETFALRGLGSLDFLLDGERVLVLEVNPRPSASVALYPRVGGGGVMRAHLHACRQGELPAVAPIAAGTVQGNEIVYAPRGLSIDDAGAARLAACPDAHDLPRGAMRVGGGEPVCSVSASGASAESVKVELARRRDAVLRNLEALR
jgi:predicted ATP-grasp superfamily ATP-dependent carboligase